jgi:hypothetical protein
MSDDLKEQLFHKDVKMVVIDNYYVFVEDLKITKFDNDYIVQMKNARVSMRTMSPRFFEELYQHYITHKTLILKEINFVILKEIPEWIDRTFDEAHCIGMIKQLEMEETDPDFLSDSWFGHIITDDIIKKQKERELKFSGVIQISNKPSFIKIFLDCFK